jgi:lipopolysaccharide/colanic/teichoic acid biosynthesis glycosyltransferase
MGKRSFDIVVSALVLLVAWPLLAAVAVLVWTSSGLPIFFGQQRAGMGFRLFRIWKFRSMRTEESGRLITVEGDARITCVGAVLRASKLDELPQFWNVLVGQMSLVGPRPEVPRYVELYREQYARVLTVRPGITDLASIVYRHEDKLLSNAPDPERYYREVVLPDKLKLALRYLDTRSLALDVRILFHTLLAMLRPQIH